MRKSKLIGDLRRERQQRELAMTAAERFAFAESLRESGLRMYMSSQGLDRESAIRAIRKTRRIGRRPSHCLSSRDAD
jgi:predicted transposase YdaD